MIVNYKNYTINIIDDPTYTLNSKDNTVQYDNEYFDGSINEDRFSTTSKHGIRVMQDGNELSSALLCEVGSATAIHENSFLFTGNDILICCSDQVYSLTLPHLEINWKKRLDPATCFGIYTFENDFIIHGELSITRIDKNGTEKWTFGARDIFVTQDGSASIVVHTDKVELKDWEGHKYTLDKNGIAIN